MTLQYNVPITVTQAHSFVCVFTLKGPNTGGKTASLKALGLAALMSKAGLFLPLISDPAAQRQPQLLWFDKVIDQSPIYWLLACFSCEVLRVSHPREDWPEKFRPAAGTGWLRAALAASSQVLADVGDGQSLQQSLSTFSAHVRRLRLILAAASPSSLVLLDEVGSGGPRASLQP